MTVYDLAVRKEMGTLKRSVWKAISHSVLGIMCILSCFPVFLLAVGALAGERELMVYLQGLFGEGGGYLLCCFRLSLP